MLRPWRFDPPRFSDVRRVWERNRCVEPGTISLYRYWICRYIDYCRAQAPRSASGADSRRRKALRFMVAISGQSASRTDSLHS